MAMMLKAVDVVKTYLRPGASAVQALRGVSLEAAAGEFVAVTGASGSGKSTLLTVLSGLDLPTAGQIWIDGLEVTQADEGQLARLRNHKIGFVFQDFHLIASMTAEENVAFPAQLAGQSQAEAEARRLLTGVGLADRRDSFPHQLSGGEKQRVALCRAVINRPGLLFADEPTGNLDSHNSEQVLRLLLNLRAQSGATLILVTHSAGLAAQADRTLVMGDGRVL